MPAIVSSTDSGGKIQNMLTSNLTRSFALPHQQNSLLSCIVFTESELIDGKHVDRPSHFTSWNSRLDVVLEPAPIVIMRMNDDGNFH